VFRVVSVALLGCYYAVAKMMSLTTWGKRQSPVHVQ